MMIKYYKLAAWVALPLLAISTGCTPVGGSSSLQREVDTLKMEVADLKDQGRLSDMRGAGGNTGGSDVRVELGRLRTDIQRLTENVETAGMGGLTLRQQLEFASARLDRLEKKASLKPLDAQKLTAVDPVPVIGGTPQPLVNDPYQNQTSDPSVGNTPAPGQGPYEEGKILFDQKQYGEAVAKFKSYLSATPKGGNASAAQFYIGESLYAQRQYEEAILEYQKVVQGFPKSSQVSTALLKQGLSFQSLGDKDSAKLLYQKVVGSYPKSYAAGVAKERLKAI